uniref:C2H2-type domain-containing protein n=1 Tax=Timema poppense TaxID=170557 RepID=A0A7R9CLA3_TIMPO|nr:unnamed protein product [Timema poppensis]
MEWANAVNTSSYSHSSPNNRTKGKAAGQELNNEESPVPYVCGGHADKRSVPTIGFEDRQSTSHRDGKNSLVNVPEVDENSHLRFLPTGENFEILENFQIEEYQYRKEYPSTRAGQFPCSNCGKVYRYQRNMSYHMKFECGKEPQFQCPLCSLRMKQRRNLRRHKPLQGLTCENIDLQSIEIEKSKRELAADDEELGVDLCLHLDSPLWVETGRTAFTIRRLIEIRFQVK